MRRTKTKVDRTAIYVAWQSCAADIDGVSYAARTGDRLRGDHALVQHLGVAAFVPDATPQDEWPSVYDAVVEAAEARPVPPTPPPRIDPATPLGDLMVCVQDILSSSAGPLREGAIVTKGDARFVAVPGVFVPLIKRLDG